MKKLFMPSSIDWINWKVLSRKLGVSQIEDGVEKFISVQQIVDLYLLTEQLQSERPPTKEEFHELIVRERSQLINSSRDIQLLGRGLRTEQQQRIIQDRLKALEKSGHVKIVKASKWQKDYKYYIDFHKSTALYALTGKGLMSLELGLTLPCFSMSIHSPIFGYQLGDAFSNFSLAMDKNRVRWSAERAFSGPLPRKFTQQVLSDCFAILEVPLAFSSGEPSWVKSSEWFWSMASPHVLIIREVYNLNSLIANYEDLLRNIKKKKAHSSLLDSANQSDRLKLHLTMAIETAVSIRETILMKAWREDLNLRNVDMNKALPALDHVTGAGSEPCKYTVLSMFKGDLS